jgi:hypothetical protein
MQITPTPTAVTAAVTTPRRPAAARTESRPTAGREPAHAVQKRCDLTIIIVNWNTRQLLQDCLEAIYAKSCMDAIEIVVVDNASTDDSVSMVRSRFSQVRVIQNVENRGFAAANNQAIDVANGRNLLLLNSDTVVLDAVINETIRFLDERPEVGAMGCLVLNTDGTVQHTCTRQPSLLNLFLATSGLSRLSVLPCFDRYLMTRWDRSDEREVEVVSGCYFATRASTLARVGPLDEAFFFFGEETDWCRRFRQDGWSLRFAPVGTIIHHGSASAVKLGSHRDLMLTEGLIRYQLKHHGRFHALALWCLLFVFNASRMVVWAAMACTGVKARNRFQHFAGVVRAYGSVWPDTPPCQ